MAKKSAANPWQIAFWIIFFFFAVLVASVLYVLFWPKSPTPVPAGWQVFENPTYKYAIGYPAGATISYGNKNCVTISYHFGAVSIGAPSIHCGRTSAAYELSYYDEKVLAAGKTYTAKVMEERGPGETLNFHNETAQVFLENGFEVEYTSGGDQVFTYAQYLQETKPVLKQMLSTLKFLP